MEDFGGLAMKESDADGDNGMVLPRLFLVIINCFIIILIFKTSS